MDTRKKHTYKCTDQDTVAGLSIKFGMTPAAFSKLNRLPSGGHLFKDQIVFYTPSEKIPSQASTPALRDSTPGFPTTLEKAQKAHNFQIVAKVPLLAQLRTKFDRQYAPISINGSFGFLSASFDTVDLSKDADGQEGAPSACSNMGFRSAVPEQMTVQEAEVHTVDVWFVMDEKNAVQGTLTTGLGRIAFEPLVEGDIKRFGIKCIVSCLTSDVHALQYIELTPDAKMMLSRSPDAALVVPDMIPEAEQRTLEFVFKLTLRPPGEAKSQIYYFLLKSPDVEQLREIMEQLLSEQPAPPEAEAQAKQEKEEPPPDELLMNTEYFDFVPELDRKSEILNEEDRRKLCAWLPERYQLCNWVLLYGTHQHGVSMNTFYRNALQTDGPSLLVLRCTTGEIFGGFASDQWVKKRPSDGFYGTGECFLFSLHPTAEVFVWSGENNFCMYSTPEELAMGGGLVQSDKPESGGTFGIWLDSEFLIGYSSPCATFQNPQMSENEQFQVIFVEFWGIQSYGEDYDEAATFA